MDEFICDLGENRVQVICVIINLIDFFYFQIKYCDDFGILGDKSFIFFMFIGVFVVVGCFGVGCFCDIKCVNLFFFYQVVLFIVGVSMIFFLQVKIFVFLVVLVVVFSVVDGLMVLVFIIVFFRFVQVF